MFEIDKYMYGLDSGFEICNFSQVGKCSKLNRECKFLGI